MEENEFKKKNSEHPSGGGLHCAGDF